MNKSYKFRIYPNAEQRIQIEKTFGCCRFVYNYFLAQRINAYKDFGKAILLFEQSRELTKMKKAEETKWLMKVDRDACDRELRHLESAYKNFFHGLKAGKYAGFPKFKSKKSNEFSYTTHKMKQNIKVLDDCIQLPKPGLVKCRVSKQVEGRILSVTVSKNPSGKYFVSISCTDVEIKPLSKTEKSVGIDLGVKSFVVDSNGLEYPNNKYLAKSEKKLARLQRQLSRKPSGSKRRERTRIKVARLYEHIAKSAQRLSTQINHTTCP